MRAATSVVAALTLVLASGCSGGDDTALDDTVTGTGEAAPDAVDSSPTTDETAPSTETTPPPTDTSPGSATTSPSIAPTTLLDTTTTEPEQPFGDIAVIESTTPTAGNGPTPTLAWSLIDDAANYTVLVADPDGAAWWAWEGTETEVVLGGVADGPGALVTRPGTTWTVIAFDAAGSVLAASESRRLDP